MSFFLNGLVIFTAVLAVRTTMAAEMFRIALTVKVLELDPQKVEDMYSMTIVNQLYGKLFKYAPDGQIRPELVEQWSVSKDKRTFTFRLKKTIFSDGSSLTANHVVNSLKRIFVTKSAMSADLSVIKGASSFLQTGNLEDLKILEVDKHTVEVQTEKPTGLLLYLLAVPDLGILKIDSPMRKLDVKALKTFSGPYKVGRTSANHIELIKWRNSEFESKNPPQRVIVNLFEKVDPGKVVAGEITDTSNFMTLDSTLSSLEGKPGWRPVASEATNERFIVMNPGKIPIELRKWMLAKFDSAELVKTLGDQSIIPAFGFIPACLQGHLKQAVKISLKELKLSKPTTIKITYGENLPYEEQFKSYLKRVWSNPNLKLEFQRLSVAEYLNVLFKKTGEVVIAARGLDYPEGYAVVTYFRSGIDSNFLFVDNKNIDNLIASAAEELDSAKRSKIYEAIQIAVLGEATVIPVAFGAWKKYYWSDRVVDVPAHPIGAHFIPFETLTMAK